MKPPLLVPSARNIRDEYIGFAKQEDVHALAGYPQSVTLGINAAAIEYARLREGRSILDVGCGDGYLLDKLGQGTGVTFTEEEASRLKEKYPGIRLIVGDMRTISTPERFDRIIINGALHLLKNKVRILEALSNLHNLALPGALLWIGDYPSNWDVQTLKNPLKAVKYVYKHQGKGAAFRYARHIWRRRFRAGKIIIKMPIYPCTPETMISLAGSCGFEIVRVWSAEEITGSLQGRFSYLFRRPA